MKSKSSNIEYPINKEKMDYKKIIIKFKKNMYTIIPM